MKPVHLMSWFQMKDEQLVEIDITKRGGKFWDSVKKNWAYVKHFTLFQGRMNVVLVSFILKWSSFTLSFRKFIATNLLLHFSATRLRVCQYSMHASIQSICVKSIKMSAHEHFQSITETEPYQYNNNIETSLLTFQTEISKLKKTNCNINQMETIKSAFSKQNDF